MDEILTCEPSNQSCQTVLYCGAVYYAVEDGVNLRVVDQILKCDHSNESYRAVLSCDAVSYALQGGSNS